MGKNWTMTWVPTSDTEGVATAERFLEAVEAIDGFSAVSDQARVAARLGARNLLVVQLSEAEPESDSSRARGTASNIAGVGIVGEGEVDLVIAPEHRGQGAGSRAFAELLHRASGEVKAWVHGDQAAAIRVLERQGFEPVRTLLRMELNPSRLPGDSATETHPPALPPGFAVEPFDPRSDSHASDFVRVNATAFANHPEQGALTLAGFTELTNEPWFRAEDLWLCYAEESEKRVAVGFFWNKVSPIERADGGGVETELYVLGVHPDFAGRGLGAALLHLSLSRMRRENPSRVSLYVEADNTAALRLYERAGFTVARQSQQWIL